MVFGVETPMTASFPSRNGANKCVFPGVTTIVWIGICSGMSKTGFSLFSGWTFNYPESKLKKEKIGKRERESKKDKRIKEKQTHKLKIRH